jgi:hypothetical protein
VSGVRVVLCLRRSPPPVTCNPAPDPPDPSPALIPLPDSTTAPPPPHPHAPRAGVQRPPKFHATSVTALANPHPPGTPGNPGSDLLLVTTSDACATVWRAVVVQGIGAVSTHFVFAEEECTVDVVSGVAPLPGQCFATISAAAPVVTLWMTGPVRRLSRCASRLP